ncbi:hypothetical protein [Paracoccus thiocyanatus]|uniref:hypothetical protein n=1 Tax=Paracoccus thiocyanatus TaxID=34006 RepID=UPI0021635B8A|nr:hypothetical protein [Paracoccus thiocyanatus]
MNQQKQLAPAARHVSQGPGMDPAAAAIHPADIGLRSSDFRLDPSQARKKHAATAVGHENQSHRARTAANPGCSISATPRVTAEADLNSASAVPVTLRRSATAETMSNAPR